jgi:hypothetical protein
LAFEIDCRWGGERSRGDFFGLPGGSMGTMVSMSKGGGGCSACGAVEPESSSILVVACRGSPVTHLP